MRAGPVFGSEAYQIQGLFENTCNKVALKLTNHACLVRRDTGGGMTLPTSFCVNDICYLCKYLGTTVRHVCALAPWPYTWYVEGFGSAELITSKGGTSPVVRGPVWAYPCL